MFEGNALYAVEFTLIWVSGSSQTIGVVVLRKTEFDQLYFGIMPLSYNRIVKETARYDGMLSLGLFS